MPRTDKKESNVVQINSDGSQRQIIALASELVSRAAIQGRLGQSYKGDRELYEALGFKLNPTFADFYARYQREGIARKIVTAPVNSSWRRKPIVNEGGEEQTAFDNAWVEIEKTHKVIHYLKRLDRLSGIGQYGVLLLGTDDVNTVDDFLQPITHASQLLYLRPFSEDNASIYQWEDDVNNRRYAMPKTYDLKPGNESRSDIRNIKVHWSRVLHVAESVDEDEVLGTPRMYSTFNYVQCLEMIVGGSAEMFWRGAFPGMALMADENASFDKQTKTALETEIQNYLHNLQRFMRLRGLEVEQLKSDVASPSDHVSVLLDMISGSTGIPKRILIGSERGELASSQDENNWNSLIEERREDHCENRILRPFIDKLIDIGILPAPKEEYNVEWPPLITKGEKEEAETTKLKTEALAKYASSPGADMIIPPRVYLRKFFGLSDDELDEIDDMVGKMVEEEQERIEEERQIIEEENRKRPNQGDEE